MRKRSLGLMSLAMVTIPTFVLAGCGNGSNISSVNAGKASPGSAAEASTSDGAGASKLPEVLTPETDLDGLRLAISPALEYSSEVQAGFDLKRERLVAECMSRAGFEYQVPIAAGKSATSPISVRFRYGLADVELASSSGYRIPDPETGAGPSVVGAEATKALVGEPTELPDGSVIPSGGCIAETDTFLFGDIGRYQTLRNEVTSWNGASYKFAAAQPETVAATDAWRSCVTGAGIQATATPGDMSVRFDLPENGGTPSADEIATATVDARCQLSSGYTRTFFSEEQDYLSVLIAANQADFDALISIRETALERAGGQS